jgi:hypothetical protein
MTKLDKTVKVADQGKKLAVAIQLNVDRFAIRRAEQRLRNDPNLMTDRDTILALLQNGTSQH